MVGPQRQPDPMGTRRAEFMGATDSELMERMGASWFGRPCRQQGSTGKCLGNSIDDRLKREQYATTDSNHGPALFRDVCERKRAAIHC